MNLDTIDLDRAEKAVSSFTTDDQRQGYQPKTMQSHNNGRRSYLPIFPIRATSAHDPLLLASVPGLSLSSLKVFLVMPHRHLLATQLGLLELTRRQHGAYTSNALLLMKDYNSRDTRGLALSQQDIEELATRLRVGPSIITFNADRLRGDCHSFGLSHQAFQRNILEKRRITVKHGLPCTSQQMAIALEFYLQMDGKSSYVPITNIRLSRF